MKCLSESLFLKTDIEGVIKDNKRLHVFETTFILLTISQNVRECLLFGGSEMHISFTTFEPVIIQIMYYTQMK